jgi:hypothetical protein
MEMERGLTAQRLRNAGRYNKRRVARRVRNRLARSGPGITSLCVRCRVRPDHRCRTMSADSNAELVPRVHKLIQIADGFLGFLQQGTLHPMYRRNSDWEIKGGQTARELGAALRSLENTKWSVSQITSQLAWSLTLGSRGC